MDLAWLELELCCYARRITPEMSAYELRQALKHLPGADNLTISLSPDGTQLVNLGDKTLEIGPMASNDEIILALQNPFIKTENTRMTVNPFDRLKDKLAKASGVAERIAIAIEAEADALIAREEALKAKTIAAFNPHKAAIDEQQANMDQFEVALDKFSNGGPV